MAVTDEAILKIKGMILSGELKPGDRLSPEKELSESLGLCWTGSPARHCGPA
jgi:GntR family transcriptional regulator, transcriptional repressor for pyruvate dehydrogenase complex